MNEQLTSSSPNQAAADIAAEVVSGPDRGPWATAFRILWRDRPAMIALAVLILIVVLSAMAPLYAQLAGAHPFTPNLNGQISLHGKTVDIMQASTTGLGLGVTPIGPTWTLKYLLGADSQGRDVAARLLYGGQTSLFIAGTATLICLVLATIIGVVAGFFGGWIDMILSRILDVLWAFPIYLLAISLSVVLLNATIHIGPFTITSNSLALPIFIVGVIYVPYVARPIRGEVMRLRRSEFVMAAIGLGIPARRILWRDILPNVMTTLIVFVPILMALNIVTESALSFLSIGVQPPNASWGTIIGDGQTLLYTRPWVSLAPGLAIVATVLALNVLGDGVRDALDPRTKLR